MCSHVTTETQSSINPNGATEERTGKLQIRSIITPAKTSTQWISSLEVVRKLVNISALIYLIKHGRSVTTYYQWLRTYYLSINAGKKCSLLWHKEWILAYWVRWAIQLPDNLCQIFGRYCWVWMPIGIIPAPEVIQCKLNRALEEKEMIRKRWSVTKLNHTKLKQLLNRCQECDIRLNADKLKLRKTEVTYIRHLFTSEEFWPYPKKLKAIKKMNRSKDLKGVQ